MCNPKISCIFAAKNDKHKAMDSVVINNCIRKEQWLHVPSRMATKANKKSFEKAVTDCNAVPLEAFITELKKRVTERYHNAESQNIESLSAIWHTDQR